MSDVANQLSVLLADTYALYLKTQNYHWHVMGPHFKSLHELFEMQYQDLANAIDKIAERIRILGHKAPATFTEYNSLKRIKDGDSSLDANAMVIELAQDNGALVRDINAAMKTAQEKGDEGTANLLAERVEFHEKARWMLNASRASK